MSWKPAEPTAHPGVTLRRRTTVAFTVALAYGYYRRGTDYRERPEALMTAAERADARWGCAAWELFERVVRTVFNTNGGVRGFVGAEDGRAGVDGVPAGVEATFDPDECPYAEDQLAAYLAGVATWMNARTVLDVADPPDHLREPLRASPVRGHAAGVARVDFQP